MNDHELNICIQAYMKHKILSASYLIRKLKCSEDHALTLIDEFYDNHYHPSWDEMNEI